MLSEGIRNGLFLLINCFLAFWISTSISFRGNFLETSPGKWFILIFGWGGLWLLFPQLRSLGAQSANPVMAKFWDPYGGFLWIAGIIYVCRCVKSLKQEDFLHLAMASGALAALYGILQYSHVELIWPKILNPYGNRSVSTFGNPNFISSYIVILLPYTTACVISSATFSQKFFYGFIFLSYEAMLFASLTRSSWLGAFFSILFLFFFREYRAGIIQNRRFLTFFASLALLLAVLWPAQNLKPFSFGVFDRVSEGRSNLHERASLSLDVKQNKVYSSVHQRLLIWSSAWQMGLENPMFGKGLGVFELFYPFYQGPLIAEYEAMRPLRTHANNAHNEILETWAQTGILGTGVYAWFFAVLLTAFYRYRANAAPEKKFWAVPFIAGIAGMFADNIFNVSLHFAVPGFMFWWMIGSASVLTANSLSPAVKFYQWTRKKLNLALACALVILSLAGIYYWRNQFMREIYYFRGFKFMRKNEFASAARELHRAWQYHSREVNNNYELANAYVRTGDYTQARWGYIEALKSNCGYDEIFFNLAIVNKKLEDFENALKNLRVSLAINPLNSSAYAAITEIFLKDPAKHSREGSELLEKASKILPDDPNITGALAYFYSLDGNHSAAAKVYGEAVKKDPSNQALLAHLQAATAKAASGDGYLAWVRDFKRLEEGVNKGDFSKQNLNLADNLLKTSPDNPNVLFLKSKILYRDGNLPAARQCLLKLLEIRPDDNTARYGLAVILEKEGNYKEAEKEFKIILGSDPINAGAAEHLKILKSKTTVTEGDKMIR
ncbi:MAG: O-antigen ligase family protein [Elusimicrobia bacterium]|nr:O-antigen ligase family protein [Elusimicrobiota bacterium]